jgi:hypothetical protein
MGTNGIENLLRHRMELEPRARVRPDLEMPPRDLTLEELFDGMFAMMRMELKGLTHDNPVIVVRGLSTLRGMYRILINMDYHADLYQPLLDDLQQGLNAVGAAARGKLLRQFLSPASTAEQVEEACEALTELISSGCWESWQRDFENALAECRRPS